MQVVAIHCAPYLVFSERDESVVLQEQLWNLDRETTSRHAGIPGGRGQIDVACNFGCWRVEERNIILELRRVWIFRPRLDLVDEPGVALEDSGDIVIVPAYHDDLTWQENSFGLPADPADTNFVGDLTKCRIAELGKWPQHVEVVLPIQDSILEAILHKLPWLIPFQQFKRLSNGGHVMWRREGHSCIQSGGCGRNHELPWNVVHSSDVEDAGHCWSYQR